MDEPQINRVYCPYDLNGIVQYTAHTRTFGQIIEKDSPNRSFGFTTPILRMNCWDVDAFEADQCGPSDWTMDCACPIAKFNDVKRTYAQHRFLLVELKLNCVNHRLMREDYVGKISHTRDLLQSMAGLHDTYVFLFTEAVKGLAKHAVARWKKGSGGHVLQRVLVMSPEDFNDYIGFESDYPYRPLNERDVIQTALESNAHDIDRLVDTIREWTNKAQQYKYQHNHCEFAHIREVLRSTIQQILLTMPAGVNKDYLVLSVKELGDRTDATTDE